MCGSEESVAAKLELGSEETEPKSIILIGGPWNTKHVADYGEERKILKDKSFTEHLYKRDRLEMKQDGNITSIDVFAYFGKLNDQCID
jgi:hypothetical protein